MKTFAALITAVLFSTPAMANNIRMFTGKYEVVKCQIDATRAYITIEKLKTVTNLNINYYSDEAYMDSFEITPGVHTYPGTDPEVHGKITEENVLNWVSPTWLKIETQVNNKGTIKNSTLVSLKMKGNRLTIEGGLWADEEPCVLKKVVSE